jgi:hypothetical protein
MLFLFNVWQLNDLRSKDSINGQRLGKDWFFGHVYSVLRVAIPLYLVGKMTMEVDKEKFEAVVGNLLKTPPMKRTDAKTGQPKKGKIIPAKPQR